MISFKEISLIIAFFFLLAIPFYFLVINLAPKLGDTCNTSFDHNTCLQGCDIFREVYDKCVYEKCYDTSDWNVCGKEKCKEEFETDNKCRGKCNTENEELKQCNEKWSNLLKEWENNLFQSFNLLIIVISYLTISFILWISKKVKYIWLKVVSGILTYLVFGIVVILILSGIYCETAKFTGEWCLAFFPLSLFWIIAGTIFFPLLLFYKTKEYAAKGMLIGFFIWGILVIFILVIPGISKTFSKLFTYITIGFYGGIIVYPLIGALIGFIIGKAKKK